MNTEIKQQLKHAEMAEALELKGCQLLNESNTGHSEEAAELLTQANEERFKAGLISEMMPM